MRKVFILGLLSMALGGCGVTFSTVKTQVDKEFKFEEATAVKPGMSQQQVVERLGKPAAFGVNDRGQAYMYYPLVKISGSGVAGSSIGLPSPVGVLGSKQSAEQGGFELWVLLKQGRVERLSYRRFLD